jgi:hypothetical protein
MKMKCTEALHSHRRRGRKEEEVIEVEEGQSRHPCGIRHPRHHRTERNVRIPKNSSSPQRKKEKKKIEGSQMNRELTLAKALANKLWLVLNIHSHPEPELQPMVPVLPRGHHSFLEVDVFATQNRRCEQGKGEGKKNVQLAYELL